jgi:hypothetical protein
MMMMNVPINAIAPPILGTGYDSESRLQILSAEAVWSRRPAES